MALDQVEIANSALVKLGAQPIQSFDDDSKESRLVKLRFDRVRDIVLRMHPWNCATKRDSLASEIPTPPFEFSKIFQIPSDSLRIIEVHPTPDIAYRIEQRKILSDADNIELIYIFRLEDFTLIDALCAEAISTYLAWDLSFALVQSRGFREQNWTDFTRIMSEARTTDAQEHLPEELSADLWVDSRRQFRSRDRLDRSNR